MSINFKEIIHYNIPSKNGRKYTKECFKNIQCPIKIGIECGIEYNDVPEDKYIGYISNIDLYDDYMVLNGVFNNKFKIIEDYACMPSGIGKIDFKTDKVYDYKLLCFNYTRNPAMHYEIELL